MILKGNLHAHGMKLIGYMLSAEKGEAAEFVAIRGFDYFHHDPEVAADIMQGMAAENSKSPKPFFHGHLRTDPNERLTDAQWMEAIDRMERRAGFSGQPRFVTQHRKPETGERHFHVAWFRFDPERGGVIDPGLYKLKFKEEARRIEKDFALRELSNDRRPHDLARAGTRNELEEARRLGTDLKAIRSGILDCFEKSDNGKSFAAAIRAQGMELANGDRRDCFVVVDQAGGQHALNKKLTGMTLAEIRNRLADLDRSQLPSVDQAKTRQHDREAARAAEIEQRRAAAGRRDEIGPDRAAAAAQERVKHGRAAPEQGRDNRPASGRQSAPQPEIKPLGKTAGDIRLAWQLTKTADQFAQAIEDRGLILVHVSREQAADTYRAREFAKAVGRQNRALREGFAVVDRRGNVTRIDQRTTGDQWEEIQKRLGGIDRAELMNVAEAKEAQREANRVEFRAQKEAERAQERINEPVGKTAGDIRTAWILSRHADNSAHDAEQLTEALAARGFGIARVTAAEAYESERRSAFAKEIDNRAPVYREGELVAVNGFGNVYRFDERTTGQLRDEIDKRLAGIDPAGLMSVADTKEAMREADRAAWAEARERARPATAIEQTIHDCREKARQLGAEIKQDGQPELKTVHGAAAFAGRLDQAGIAIVRVTAADEKALDTLRADQQMERLAAETNVETRRAHYFDDVKAGEIAAIDRFGNVHRLNPYKLNLENIERTLLEEHRAHIARGGQCPPAERHRGPRRVRDRARGSGDAEGRGRARARIARRKL